MPLVPSFKTTTSTTSIMLSFFLCSSNTIDEDDTFTHSYVPYSVRTDSRTSQPHITLSQPPDSPTKRTKTKRTKKSKMVIGAPTNFRHEVHLGSEFKTDLSYAFWDSERWRQELMKKDLFLPPLPESVSDDTMDLLPLPPKLNDEKRRSITPQKRKPVPSLLPPVRSPAEPHEVPLPPTPATSSDELQTFEDAHSHQSVSLSHKATFSDFSLPTTLVASEPSSRGPSMDDDHAPLPDLITE